ncbi:MAG: glycosyltransferase family 2 protein [Clostridia bacterium]|nr:glycosyltransferase family 2 protein [Clostridia bacterium]
MITLLIRIVQWVQGALSLLLSYFPIYAVFGFFATRKFKKTEVLHRYAVLIAARNEEAVIGNLIESIRRQDYPSDLLTVFVVADHCSDGTASKAREYGAVCYERSDDEGRTKGFALKFLIDCLHRDYGKDAFEGYFIFDADNLLAPDYVSRMNEAFDEGEKIITSYRHTKNFDDNWISASYGLHWLRTVRCEHRARSLFHLATRIQGTGILVHEELLRNGWHYTSLTEDRELCAHAVAEGYRISFQYDAVFYDEQPTDLKIAYRQRLRWSKGNLWVFFHEGKRLFRGIFRSRGLHRFVCYDMLCIVFPRAFFSVLFSLALGILGAIAAGGKAPIGIAALVGGLGGGWIGDVVMAAYIFVMERRRIPKMKWYRILWYCFTFPIFDIFGKITICIAAFTKVEWKPIPHVNATSITDIADT